MSGKRDDLLRWIGFDETREYLERVDVSYQIYRELYRKLYVEEEVL